jgi:hypothetical protein
MPRMHTDTNQLAIEAENPSYPEPIRARLRVVAETAAENLKAINARMARDFEAVRRDGNAILRSKKSKIEKIYAVWSLADRLYAGTGKNVACRRGCSHCCHIGVAVHPLEAEAIGKRIGRTPRENVNLRKNVAEGFAFGYGNPCTFLKDGECSIYAHRPLACRVQFSLDVDSLLCELRPPEVSPVPYLNPTDINFLLLQVIEPTGEKCLADIREYFPPRK